MADVADRTDLQNFPSDLMTDDQIRSAAEAHYRECVEHLKRAAASAWHCGDYLAALKTRGEHDAWPETVRTVAIEPGWAIPNLLALYAHRLRPDTLDRIATDPDCAITLIRALVQHEHVKRPVVKPEPAATDDEPMYRSGIPVKDQPEGDGESGDIDEAILHGSFGADAEIEADELKDSILEACGFRPIERAVALYLMDGESDVDVRKQLTGIAATLDTLEERARAAVGAPVHEFDRKALATTLNRLSVALGEQDILLAEVVDRLQRGSKENVRKVVLAIAKRIAVVRAKLQAATTAELELAA